MPNTAEVELRRLLDIMAALRDPDHGCPWDRTQSFESIAPYTIEEAYEVADAIARHDFAALADELGDLLFQVVYHARLAEEAGRFAFAEVANRIATKMVRRHPHVFPHAETTASRNAAIPRVIPRGRPTPGRRRNTPSVWPARRPAASPACRQASLPSPAPPS
jgi:nucleoside triphosphate diphosphatase